MRLLIIIIMIVGFVYGVELERGKTYDGPIKLTVKSLGVSFGFSYKWRATLPQKGGLVLESKEKDARIIMNAKNFSAEEAIGYLNQSIKTESDEMLFPTSRITKLSPTKFHRIFRINGQETVAMVYVILGSQQRAVVMMGFSLPDSYMQLQSEMLPMANTITFTALKPPLMEEDSLSKQLRGGHFTYYEAIGSHSEKRELWLCTNGYFLLHANYTSASGISNVLMEHHGTWALTNDLLQLNEQNGFQKVISIQAEGNGIYFNKSRSYRLRNRACH